jgi:hypothetical protein
MLKKLSVATLQVNDYVLFESMTDLWGMPYGHSVKPGDRVYYRVKQVYPSGRYVWLINPNTSMMLADSDFSDDNTLTVPAQFPAILHEWVLHIKFPTTRELPWRLRLRRALTGLFIRKGKS